MDRARQVNGWKSIPYPKTVYDPNVISDEEILELSKKAALRGYDDAVRNGNTQFSETVKGIKFRIYINKTTGDITNVLPEI